MLVIFIIVVIRGFCAYTKQYNMERDNITAE